MWEGVRERGRKRCLVEEECEERAGSEEGMISEWLELDLGAAGRRSEDAREEARDEDESEEGTLLESAWVSVVRSCEEDAGGILVDLGREEGKKR